MHLRKNVTYAHGLVNLMITYCLFRNISLKIETVPNFRSDMPISIVTHIWFKTLYFYHMCNVKLAKLYQTKMSLLQRFMHHRSNTTPKQRPYFFYKETFVIWCN